MHISGLKILILSLVIILATLLHSNCAATSGTASSRPPANNMLIQVPYGDWYATNRHMHIGQRDHALIDTIMQSDGDKSIKYKIIRLIERTEDIYLLTLKSSKEKSMPEQRLFSLSSNHQSMREFKGSRVILWTRTP